MLASFTRCDVCICAVPYAWTSPVHACSYEHSSAACESSPSDQQNTSHDFQRLAAGRVLTMNE